MLKIWYIPWKNEYTHKIFTLWRGMIWQIKSELQWERHPAWRMLLGWVLVTGIGYQNQTSLAVTIAKDTLDTQHVIDVVKAYPNGKVLSQIKAMQHVLNKNEMSVFFQRPYSTGLPPLPAGYDNTKELTDKLCKQTLAVKQKPNKRLPSSYLCHLCFIKGHFIQDCSLVNYVWMFEWSVAIYNAITYIDL